MNNLEKFNAIVHKFNEILPIDQQLELATNENFIDEVIIESMQDDYDITLLSLNMTYWGDKNENPNP